MGISSIQATEAAAPASKLVCTKCGAGVNNLTLDAQIIVTFRINEKGRIFRLKSSSSEEELIERATEEDRQYKTMFCDFCGHYMDIVYSDDGLIIGFADISSKQKNKVC